jgi:hypothetical protein
MTSSERTRLCPRGRRGASVRTRSCPRGRKCIRADALVSASTSVRMQGRVRADASRFIPGNFITDATVRTSHGRPNGHRPSVRPSERPSVRRPVRASVGPSERWSVRRSVRASVGLSVCRSVGPSVHYRPRDNPGASCERESPDPSRKRILYFAFLYW